MNARVNDVEVAFTLGQLQKHLVISSGRRDLLLKCLTMLAKNAASATIIPKNQAPCTYAASLVTVVAKLDARLYMQRPRPFHCNEPAPLAISSGHWHQLWQRQHDGMLGLVIKGKPLSTGTLPAASLAVSLNMQLPQPHAQKHQHILACKRLQTSIVSKLCCVKGNLLPLDHCPSSCLLTCRQRAEWLLLSCSCPSSACSSICCCCCFCRQRPCRG